jgi:hypothetical protein
MFETNDEGKLPLFSSDGRHLWSFVGIRLQNPWLHVQYAVFEESGEWLTRTVFLSDIGNLLEISRLDNVKLQYVDLVSPDHVNGAERWKMEPLQQILRRQIEEEQSWLGYVFVLESGAQYTYPSFPPEDAKCVSHLIFQI